MKIRFNPPRNITWLVSLVLIACGIVLKLLGVVIIQDLEFWLVAAGGILLLLGTLLTNL